MKKFVVSTMLVAMSLTMSSCATDSRSQLLATEAGAVQLRSIQTRSFETNDKTKMLRAALATLQDLGFVVDKADETLGTVSATKLDGYNLRMTVNIRQKNAKDMVVRANADFNSEAVTDPEPYQRFFDAYSKAVFLEAHQVD